jgi:uncharacterized protein
MLWSHYNKFFRSRNSAGGFVYNALSNSLIELDQEHYNILEQFRSEQNEKPVVSDKEFLRLLREKYVLVEPGEEEEQLWIQHYQRHKLSFSDSVMTLAICPTSLCNFRCPYCFENSQKNGKNMTEETGNRLVEWLGEQKNIRYLSVTWYGGEPLLAFDTICFLTEKLRKTGIELSGFGLITNGYLLDDAKISRLNELGISSVQITLDGNRETHDKRRYLAGGKPTFDRILENIAALMNSDYSGVCNVRVNVDKNNSGAYLELRQMLLQRFKGKKLFVYPGRVDTDAGNTYDSVNCLSNCEWSDFNLELYGQYSVIPDRKFYPEGFTDGLCTANRQNAFVVGPEGELYKCWDDVGKPEMVVGNIYAKETITDNGLCARYSLGVDAYNDPQCRACEVLPICGGGCPHKRLLKKFYGGKDGNHCSVYKERLIDYLEAYIDIKRRQEICRALLQPGKSDLLCRGYRLLYPQNSLSDNK